MRLGLFVALFALLLGIVALIVPAPGTLALYSADRRPPDEIVADELPVCLTLSYDDPERAAWLPTTLRLDSHAVPAHSVGDRVAYHAEGGGREHEFTGAVWWGVGRDSIDVAGHHTRHLRLSARGDTLAGRAAWPDHPNFFVAAVEVMLYPEPTVRAVKVPCG